MKFDNLDFDNMSLDEIHEELKRREEEVKRIEALSQRINELPKEVSEAIEKSPTIHGKIGIVREYFKEIGKIHLEVMGEEPDYEEDFKWMADMEKKFALKN